MGSLIDYFLIFSVCLCIFALHPNVKKKMSNNASFRVTCVER